MSKLLRELFEQLNSNVDASTIRLSSDELKKISIIQNNWKEGFSKMG